MKNNKIFKSLFFVFLFMMTFFMFFDRKVSALDTTEIKPNVFLELTLDGEEYQITGAYHTCGSDSSCLDSVSGDFVLPGTYNDKKITSIGDSSDMSSVGVLDGIKDIVTGSVTVSDNMKVIGVRAFYGFTNLNKVVLSNSVILIKDYAFEDSGIETLYITRYEVSDSIKATELESVNAFASTAKLSKIVFPNYNLLGYYKNNVAVYGSLAQIILDKFTYEVNYIYHLDNNACGIDNCISVLEYHGNKIEKFPSVTPSTGLELVDWFSVSTGLKVNLGDVVKTENSTFDVMARWDLKNPEVSIATYHKGLKEDDNSIVYAGKDDTLDVVVDVDHELIGTNGFVISYRWQKQSGIISDLTETNNIYKLSFAGNKATYICNVTISYLSYEKVVSVSIDAEILRKDLIINVNDNTVEYGTYAGAGFVNNSYFTIDPSTSLVDGQIIKMNDVVVNKYTDNNSDLNVGTYLGVLEVVINNIGYEDSEENYSSNYNITYNNGNLVVEKKNILISLDENIEFVYGEQEVLSFVKEDVVYDGITKQLMIGYNRRNPTVSDVGEYEIVSINVDDNNYIASFSAGGSGKVVILKKTVSVDWHIDDNLVYNSQKKDISASYMNIKGEKVDLLVEVVKDSVISDIVNAGNYVANAKMSFVNGNYELIDCVKNITIEKAESDFIGNNTQTVIYNGYAQRVDVSLNHNEGVLVYGDYSMCKNAQTSSQTACPITVSVNETANYKGLVETFYLRIKPYALVVEPDVMEIPYGTAVGISNLKKVVEGVNNEEVLVYFSKEGSSTGLDVGKYNVATAYLIGSPNYTVTLKENTGFNKIKIIPAEVEVRFYFYENLVYDGKVKDIKIKVVGTNDDVGLQVDYNGKEIIKNAGKYRINVSLTNTNYKIEGMDYLEFEIAKANYDISNLKLEDKNVKFNFKSHAISIQGDLPLGVSASYTIDNNVGNGTYLPFSHTITVTFDGDYDNYNYIEAMSATLYINITWLFVTIGVVLGVVLALTVTFILLLKYGVIRFTDKIQRKRLKKIIKRNRAILAINETFKKNKEKLEKANEEEIIIEEDIKFVKNHVDVPREELISLSFVDKLFRSDISTKQYYSEVKNELLSYAGVVSKIKRNYETFYVNNVPIAKFDVVDDVLQVYFALDPIQYSVDEYKHKNVSRQKDFVAVPLRLSVNNIDSLRHAKMFVRIIRKREKLKFSSNFIREDYVKVYTAKENSFKLFKKSRVKKGSKESLED